MTAQAQNSLSTSMQQPTGKEFTTMHLNSAFRLALYGVFAVLFVSGALWLLADRMKNSADADSEIWQQASTLVLSLHGGAGMMALMLLGALGPMHIQRAWRTKINLATGIICIAVFGLLILTAFGLYYIGSEAVRPWISYVHIAFGLAVPGVVAGHIMVGRASIAAMSQKVRMRVRHAVLVRE
jgi:small-conductance mechanosensitive channel